MSNSLPEEKRFRTSGFEPDVIIDELVVGGFVRFFAGVRAAA